ncbi:flippase-like domain-containing protein [Candidatus Woesearchaeota archaeon]|nr:flippase-like domain-containing protein [Candidatus Woesearchaeota archaeon]
MKYVKRTLGIILSIIIIIILFKVIDINDIILSLKKLALPAIIGSGLFYTLSYIFRAVRFKILLQKKLSSKILFTVVCLHNFFNNILPARTGEISYVYLLKRRKIETSRGISSLFIARILDVLFILVLLLSAVPFLYKRLSMPATVLIIFILVLLILTPFLLLEFKTGFIKIVKKILLALKLKKKTSEKLIGKTEEMIESLRVIKSKKIFIKTFISTILIIGSQYGFYYLILHGLGIELSAFSMVLALGVVMLAGILPVQGIAGIGTYEGAWALSLIFLGIAKETAIVAGFVIHIMQVLFLVLLGLFGFLISLKQKFK